MSFQIYSDQNPPKRGNGKRIYLALKGVGFQVYDLHYNPNCWMRDLMSGWATWACEITASDGEDFECWCGWDNKHGAYLQSNTAPYGIVWLSTLTRARAD